MDSSDEDYEYLRNTRDVEISDCDYECLIDTHKERLDIAEVLTDYEEDPQGETGVQRISPVQFLRDRELGIRGTSERIVRQRVYIEPEPAYNWPDHVRWKVYRRMWDKCEREEEGSYAISGVSSYDETADLNYNYWLMKIHRKIESSGRALYIRIDAGIGRCVELLAMNNLRLFLLHSDRWTDPRHKRWYDKVFTDQMSDFEQWEEKNLYFMPKFKRYEYIHSHYTVQDTERQCLSCEQITCKCSVEKCDVF